MTIPDDQIQDIALAAGFTLKPQPDGGMALHPHVFEFARAMISAGQQAAQDQIADLLQQLEQSSESFQVAILSSGQWQQRAELAERQRDEWLAAAMQLQARFASAACQECGGSSIAGVLPADGGAVHYEPCTRCGGLGSIGVRRPAKCRHCGGTGKEPA